MAERSPASLLAPASGDPRSDHESLSEKEEKRKKRMKWAAYIAAFSVFQVIVILVFVLVIMRVRRPRFRIGQFAIDQSSSFLINNNQSLPSFNLSFTAPIRVKNTNFGPYKYDATNVVFMYGGVPFGTVAVPKSKANFKSTKKINLQVNLSSAAVANSPTLGTDLNSGNLTITSQGKMNGKVEMMFIFKKKKATEMNCTMTINVQAKTLQSVNCK